MGDDLLLQYREVLFVAGLYRFTWFGWPTNCLRSRCHMRDGACLPVCTRCGNILTLLKTKP